MLAPASQGDRIGSSLHLGKRPEQVANTRRCRSWVIRIDTAMSELRPLFTPRAAAKRTSREVAFVPLADISWSYDSAAHGASFRSPAYTPAQIDSHGVRPMTRRAACSCGQLHLTIEGEPSRISMCHCLECQRRTGAVISNQARFRREQVTFAGKATAWMRTAESGNALTFHFCPTCGSTVYWENEGFPGYVAVAIGNFADPNFLAPTIAVWEESRHSWFSLPPNTPPKRVAKQG